MKKLFTLTVTLMLFNAAAFSQTIFTNVSLRAPAISVSFGHRYIETYSMSKNQRDILIANINANYNQQVRQAMNLRIGAAKKIDLIQQLQRERNNRIKNINDRFFDWRNKYNYNHYDTHFNWIR
jgi:hypothetical protein